MGIVYQEGPSLARDLGLPLRTLYAVSNRIPAHYHRAEVPKRDGGVRVLRVPDLCSRTSSGASPGCLALRHARVAPMPRLPIRRGVVENARRHVGRPELLKLDILHFFDSIRYIQVKEAAFPAEIYAEPQEQCLRRLLGQVDFWLQAQPDSQEAAEYRRWLLDEMRDGR